MDKVIVEYNSSNGVFVQHRIMDREYTVRDKRHAYCEFLYLLQGKIDLEVEGAKRQVNAGEVILINSNLLHVQKMSEGVLTELIVVGIVPACLPTMINFDFVNVIQDNPILKHCLPKTISEKFHILEDFKHVCVAAKHRRGAYKELYVCAEIIKLIATLSKAVDGIILPKNEGAIKLSQSVLTTKCINYLNSNLFKKITVEEIASNLCCSKSYLQHLFKKEMKTSISEYINIQKMSIAQVLLNNNMTPMEVSDKLGFEYYSTFSSKFKKFYGVSPKRIKSNKIAVDVDVSGEI